MALVAVHFDDFPADDQIGDRWRRHAECRPESDAVIHCVAGQRPRVWKWGELYSAATDYTAWLRASGVQPGQVCAIIIRHHPDFYPIYMGVELAGAIPAVLAYPNARLHPEKFQQGIEGMAARSGLNWILTERDLEPLATGLVATGGALQGLLFPLEKTLTATYEPYSSAPDEPCLLQHSSGTTGLQKAVVLSHRAVLGHLQRYGSAIGIAPEDRIVSWLPLYHDMGLIAAFHQSLAYGVTLIQLDPFEWAMAPYLFIEAIHDFRATLAWLPNFAYHHMAARVRDDEIEGMRLDSIRFIVNCSEPVRADAHTKFSNRFGPSGLNPGTLGASYAMAETTFAVTQTVPGLPAKILDADVDALARGHYIPATGGKVRACVSSGKLIADTSIQVIDESGEELGDDRVGELVIRSSSMFDGYRNNPEKTAEVLRDGWYKSGDFGFRHGEEYYVIGRKKDLIIVAGKNIYPEDIEDALNSVPGVLPGRVVAFAIDDPENGTERVAVAFESQALGTPEEPTVRRSVQMAGSAIGVTISEIFIVPPRWLIKSSAGKPSRAANRDRLLNANPKE